MRSPLEGFCCSSSSCWFFVPLPFDFCCFCFGEGKEEEKTDEEREEDWEEDVKEEGLDSTRVVQAILMATDFERVTFAAK